MYLLGIDVGTSAIKASVIEIGSQACVAVAQYPDSEAEIHTLQPGWAEQDPEQWWEHTQKAVQRLTDSGTFDLTAIKAIGIAYQMHGLVLIDANQQVLRDSIIWCDSRAVPYGEEAFTILGEEECLSTLLNSPGNFTAAKLAWVKENEPAIYRKIDKIILPGDFIAMKLTGNVTTSVPALSEGVFWDFRHNEVAAPLMEYFGFEERFIPQIRPVFSEHGRVSPATAELLGLMPGTPVTYKAGDQPNNALSLNVLRPGEVAATAGTSGVIYAVGDGLNFDPQSRINTFAHVNYTEETPFTGVLLCINGTGSMYRWAKNNFAPQESYKALNELASTAPIGSNGLLVSPFGNGAERMLNNRYTGAQLMGIDLNKHQRADIFRAVQEGIAFAFRYGLDIMRENGLKPKVIRAGNANLFLSEVFTQTFVDVTGIPVELYQSDGSIGAAIGGGIGAGHYENPESAFRNHQLLKYITPQNTAAYEPVYQRWKDQLFLSLANAQ